MNRTLSFFIVLTGCLLLITCTREYSYEGSTAGNHSAVYTISCAGAVPAGEYYSGIALTTANIIELDVEVTDTGTYNISTATINGFRFSAKGRFAATGVQKIILTGSGTPVAKGNYTLKTPGTAGCSFTVTITDIASVPAGFTLAGAPGACQTPVVNGNYIEGIRLDASHNVIINVNVTAIGAYTIRTDTLDGISFSGSGTFTATGVQKVMLTGSGLTDHADNLTFTLLTGTTGCTFAVTVSNIGPPAAYVLESGTNGTDPICQCSVLGSYTAKTSLTAANTIRESVYVITPGVYTIATNMVNGIRFYATGTFTTTGSQTVLLQGTGTPAAAGTYSFLSAILGTSSYGGNSCFFDIKVQ